MSGSTIGGVVGGVIGFFVGGPAGAQWGFMIGSAIGGYVDPVKVQGPRLKDAMQQTSQEGVPIPFGYGTFPTAGNIIWVDEIKEHKHKDRQGKGGGAEQTTYTYTRSYAVGICKGPIAGLLMIKRNGKIVWDARDQPSIEEWLDFEGRRGSGPFKYWLDTLRLLKAWNARFANIAAIYTGDEAQLPDPTIEAVEGVGKVSAFRGLAYIVVKDDDVTELQGAVPQFEFIVAASGVSTADNSIQDELARTHLEGNQDYVSARAFQGGVLLMNSPGPMASGGSQTYTLGFVSERLSGPKVAFFPVPDDISPTLNPMANGPGGFLLVGDGSGGTLRLMQGDSTAANLIAYPGASTAWAYGYGSNYYTRQFGNLVAFSGDSVYTLIQATNGVSNALLRWPLVNVAGGDVYPTGQFDGVALDPINTGASMLCLESGSLPWTLNVTDRTLRAYTPALVPTLAHTLPMPLDGTIAFCVGDGSLFLLQRTDDNTLTIKQYQLGTWTPLASETVHKDTAWSDRNATLSIGAGFICVQVAADVAVLGYTGGCLGGLPVGYEAIPDSPGWAVSPSGAVVKSDCSLLDTALKPEGVLLATIVADLCSRIGLAPDEIDVSDLTPLVLGYKVATESGADGMIAALMPAYFFDAAEFDGRLNFIRRGGDATFSLTMDDLGERDGEAVELTRVQEPELLRKVTVGYIDPLATYTTATQAWERRAATVEAKGESAVEVPIVATAQTAARIAERRGKVAWSETEKGESILPSLRFARLTPTDVGELHLRSGQVLRIRMTSAEEDSGRTTIEFARDRQAAYVGTASGVRPPPPIITEPSLRGPTRVIVMDLPVWRETDDQLGVYVAVAGVLPGWRGAQVQVSSDGGATYNAAIEATVPATIGKTVTGLSAWTTAEYPSQQTLTVELNDTPPSASMESLLRYGNRAAVELASGGWEILQFRTVTTNPDGTFTLSGLVRGRYATAPGEIAVDARFVLLDSAVQFVPVEAWMLGRALKVRGVTYGGDADAVTAQDASTAGISQREWRIENVWADRDGSTVTVTWLGRGRIGTEIAPRTSRYFAGYRVIFSDGHVADVAGTSYVRADTPAGVTVSVAALNSITGPGPSSEAVSA